ncbi:hypothetical protein D4764_19G0008610 [Takifugu flavidus]|uniref:Uncharacterized protein n=1 Tax=Takifugu flavidus TaxID=433684 RepID=A0A5C6NN89_9TELE|nr:hypothetical protein D4764_19G0008610 [Takifugu flavidus]
MAARDEEGPDELIRVRGGEGRRHGEERREGISGMAGDPQCTGASPAGRQRQSRSSRSSTERWRDGRDEADRGGVGGKVVKGGGRRQGEDWIRVQGGAPKKKERRRQRRNKDRREMEREGRASRKVSWTMRIKLLLFLNSEKRQGDKDTIPPGSPWLRPGAELHEGGREGGSGREGAGGRRRQEEAGGGGRGSIIKLIPSQFPLGAK